MQLQGLIAGLGNPGKEYERTRHNFGFMAVDALLREAGRAGSETLISGQKDTYRLWKCTFPGSGQWLLTMPLTFMNRSGEAIQGISSYYRLPPEKVLVIHDELDLPLGRMKLKKGGGNAGHNGLRSIQQLLGTPDFYRLRLGIGKQAGSQAVGHVLSRFSAEEMALADMVVQAAVQGLSLFMREGPQEAQRFCNGYRLPEAS